MRYVGYLLKESLADDSVLDRVTIRSVREEALTGWHGVVFELIGDATFIDEVSTTMSSALHPRGWYITFFSDEGTLHVIYPDQYFTVPRDDRGALAEAASYGKRFDIPEPQLDFTWPHSDLDAWIASQERFAELQRGLIMAIKSIESGDHGHLIRLQPGEDTWRLVQELNEELEARELPTVPAVKEQARTILRLRGPTGDFFAALFEDAVRRLRPQRSRE